MYRALTIEKMEQISKDHGHHWFDPASKRFFRSRILCGCNEAGYFVTSEQNVSYYPTYHADPRMYTIRRFNPETGGVDTVGEFQEFKTSRAAYRQMDKLTREYLEGLPK